MADNIVTINGKTINCGNHNVVSVNSKIKCVDKGSSVNIVGSDNRVDMGDNPKVKEMMREMKRVAKQRKLNPRNDNYLFDDATRYDQDIDAYLPSRKNISRINGKTYTCDGSLSVRNGSALCNGEHIDAVE